MLNVILGKIGNTKLIKIEKKANILAKTKVFSRSFYANLNVRKNFVKLKKIEKSAIFFKFKKFREKTLGNSRNLHLFLSINL